MYSAVGSIQEFIILLEEHQKVRPKGEGDKPHVNKLQWMAIVKGKREQTMR